ncbi:MAG: serine/threonine protein phosphatase [Cyanobacteria bacterium]|nr:serine/threonine protein phosphatase [Cyanobacteriota bacterium]MDW8201012.1 metallophosphoesterase family protein [Cyanobacteriota bacterium SKYGB_h_bin112]
MAGRRIVVGDVHGHYEGLMLLMEAITPHSDDKVYFLGDLIDRGPQSASVVDFIIKQNYQSLLGNHEQLLLEAFPDEEPSPPDMHIWLCSGGQETVTSYSKDLSQLFEHLKWFRTLPNYLDLGDFWLVHAGVHPGLAVHDQTAQELCWIRTEFHSMTEPYFADKTIIVGHTITFTLPGVKPGELAQGSGWIDIDTGAYHPKSGWLTAIDLDNRWVYQVNVYHSGQFRSLPLDEAIAHVKPQDVLARYRVVSHNHH